MDQPRCYISRSEQTESHAARQDLVLDFLMNGIYPGVEAQMVTETGEKCPPDCPNCHGEDERVIIESYVRTVVQN